MCVGRGDVGTCVRPCAVSRVDSGLLLSHKSLRAKVKDAAADAGRTILPVASCKHAE